MFTLKTMYGSYENCVWGIRGKGKNIRYEIYGDDGPIMTVNVPGYGKSDKIVAIKDYSENAGIMSFLEKHGLIKQVHGYVSSGFVLMPLVELDIKKMEAMNR